MAGGIITIARRKYAAGLFWQPAQGRGNPRENAAKIAKIAKIRANLFVQFNSMIALSDNRRKLSAGMPVAAPAVIEALNEKNFLAAFSIKEGFWLLAVRGGIIIKDKIFPDVETAQKEYADLNAMPDWGLLIAPDAWAAPAAVTKNIDEIIDGSKKYRLSNISNLPGYIMTVFILAVTALVGFSFFEEPIKKLLLPSPQKLNIDPAIAAEYKRKLEEIEAPMPKPDPIIVQIQLPYESLPKITDKAEQCWRAIAFLSQQITGWNVESVSCIDGEASAQLVRNFGTTGELYDEVQKIMPGVEVTETGGNDVILVARLRPLDPVRQIPEFDADQIMAAVQSVFQRINEDVTFRRDFMPIQIPELGENEAPSIDVTELPIVRIEATSKLQPMEFIKIMDDLAGVEIPLIKWDNQSRSWGYEVIIYVK